MRLPNVTKMILEEIFIAFQHLNIQQAKIRVVHCNSRPFTRNCLYKNNRFIFPPKAKNIYQTALTCERRQKGKLSQLLPTLWVWYHVFQSQNLTKSVLRLFYTPLLMSDFRNGFCLHPTPTQTHKVLPRFFLCIAE